MPGDPQVVAAALAAAPLTRWLSLIDARNAELPPSHPDRQATSGSLRLPALGAVVLDEMLRALCTGPAAPLLRARLGPAPLCLAGQCWARCQYPAALRPLGQHPHQWHQDGALGCRFDAEPCALIEMLTLWVPLMDCGEHAPSLQWLRLHPAPAVPLPPAELTDEALAQRWGLRARHHATLRAGDALVFDGALLHRSHVTPAMTQRRVSIELRFVAALPPRLRHEPVLVARLSRVVLREALGKLTSWSATPRCAHRS